MATINDTDTVPSDWSDGTTMTVSEWGQREWKAGALMGRCGGVDFALSTLRGQAMREWLAGNSRVAETLKGVAELIQSNHEVWLKSDHV